MSSRSTAQQVSGDGLTVPAHRVQGKNTSSLGPKGRLRLSPQWEEARKHKLVFIFGLVFPVLVFAAFVGYPIVYTIYLSFHKWDGISDVIKFVGLGNFSALLHDPAFGVAFANTAKWTVGALFFSNVLGFLLAVVLRSKAIYFGKYFRVLFFLPVTLSFVATGVMFSFILNPLFGAVSEVFQTLGLGQGPDLLGNPSTALYTLIGVSGWASFGISILLFDAGLTQIPTELYESARLDGARAFAQFRFVTVPMMRAVSVIVAVLSVLEALRAFDLIYAMTRGGPGQATTTLGYFMWVDAFDEQQFGYGSAIATVIVLLSVTFAVVYIKRAGREALGEQN